MRYPLLAAIVCVLTFLTHAANSQTRLDSLIKAESIDSVKVQELLQFAWQNKYNDPSSAFKSVDAAVSVAQSAKDDRLMGNAFYYKGMMCYLTTAHDSAIHFSDKAINHYQLIKNDYGIASIYNLKGLVNERLSNYEGAIEQYLKSVEYAELTDNLYSQSNPLHNIGLIYEKMKDYKRGLAYFEKALKIREEIGDSSFLAASHMSIASMNQYLGNDSLTLAYSNRAIDWFENLDDTYNLMIAYNNLGQYYLKKNDLQVAEQLFEKSTGLAPPETYPENFILSTANRIILKNKQKKYREAIQIGERALKIAKANDLMWNEKEILTEMVHSYYALGNIHETYKGQQRLIYLTDSLINQENLTQIANMETRYRLKEKELTIAKKNIELSVKSQAIQLQIALILLLLISILLFFWRNRIKKEQQRIQSRLDMNQERSRIAMDLHDHVGAELTLVSSKLDTRIFKTEQDNEKQDLGEIAEQVRGVSTTLRETVWSIRQESIIVQELLDQVHDFAVKILEESQIKFHRKTSIPGHSLQPQKALMLYRICQEGITNSFKYADAKNIELSIDFKDEKLCLLLQDDGNGFAAGEPTSGYGLDNMRQRAAQANASFSIGSIPGGGTRIEVEV
ncbi:MAG: sensor histidine kinase [Cyclobacteriaceae bacterium]